MDLLTSTLLLGIGGSILYSLKEIPSKGWKYIKARLIYRVKILDKDHLYYEFEEWLKKNYGNNFRNLEAGFDLDTNNNLHHNSPSGGDDNDRKVKTLKYRQESNVFLIKYKDKRIFVKQSREQIQHAKSIHDMWYFQFEIYGFKAIVEIKELLQEVTDIYNASLVDNRLSIYAVNGYSSIELLDRRFIKPLSQIILPQVTRDLILNNIRAFTTNRNWYNENNILYKRSLMFYGPPGTGKTTLAMAVASELKRDLLLLNLASFQSDQQFIGTIMDIDMATKVILIEDADSAFEKRTNKEGNKLSFSMFINWLDGALSKENQIVIITTNHIEKLDAALLRDGRMDLRVEVGNVGIEEVQQFFHTFYPTAIPGEAMFNPTVSIPMATVQEICLSSKTHWEAVGKINRLAPDYTTEFEAIND